ncbi:MAG: DegT/DnrJ/EryC1/StrS family aminotransferase, partial [Fimbriimonadales bacterium]
MRVPFVDVRSQYAEVRAVLDPWVSEILETGAYVLGKHNRALEEEIAARHGVRHGIAVNSGTDALRIMLDATGIGPGDEVITTAFTFVSSLE